MGLGTMIAGRRLAAPILGSVFAVAVAAPAAMGWLRQPPGLVCAVDQVLDGDSLRMTCAGEPLEVRLHCIDAPEYEEGSWGKQSLRHLREITPRQVEVKVVEIDRFGRTVAEVFTIGPDRRFLNLEQVQSGNAAVYNRYCSDSAFTRAEQSARKAGRGIWSRPGEQQTPWVFRHRQGR